MNLKSQFCLYLETDGVGNMKQHSSNFEKGIFVTNSFCIFLCQWVSMGTDSMVSVPDRLDKYGTCACSRTRADISIRV